MLKIFHFSHKPPFPIKDGGCFAIHSILKSLLITKNIEVFHFTIGTHKHPFNKGAYPDTWKEKAFIDGRGINTKTSLFGAIKYLIKNKSYNIERFDNEVVREAVKDYLEGVEFDIAIFESIFVLPYLDLFQAKGIKVIVRTHNVEFQIWEEMAENARSNIRSAYYRKLAKQLKKYELEQLAKIDGIVAIAQEDADYFKIQFPNKKIITIPPAMHSSYPKADYSIDDFFFLGAMDWKPNQEGIEWLYNEVIPNGLEKGKFYLAGKGLKKNKYKHPSVQVEGEVKSALEFITNHGICVIPLHSGGGIKIKLLENMAMGKPIITTSEGIRGVNVTHEKEVLIADTPTEFKECMMRLQENQELRRKLGLNARNFIEDNYGENKLTKELIAFLKDI